MPLNKECPYCFNAFSTNIPRKQYCSRACQKKNNDVVQYSKMKEAAEGGDPAAIARIKERHRAENARRDKKLATDPAWRARYFENRDRRKMRVKASGVMFV